MQLTQLFPEIDRLHAKYGDPSLTPIYGAGCIDQPELCLMFMVPTARNVSADPSWHGLRAPWIGTKHVWKLLHRLGLWSDDLLLAELDQRRPEEWEIEIAAAVYGHINARGMYVTNLAKCTQPDARHLPLTVYKDFRDQTLRELAMLKPKKVIAFGNQVSSALLDKPISVSHYLQDEHESIDVDGQLLTVYPCYYPVGQGARNISKAEIRIREILET